MAIWSARSFYKPPEILFWYNYTKEQESPSTFENLNIHAMKTKKEKLFSLKFNAKKNIFALFDVLEKVLKLSNQFRTEKLGKYTPQNPIRIKKKKLIREIASLVTTKDKEIKKLVAAMRDGSLEEVKIIIGKKSVMVSYLTDYKHLIAKHFKIKKDKSD
jgi:hypothetical protein